MDINIGSRPSGSTEEIAYQKFEIRNALPINVFLCMEYASYLNSTLPYHKHPLPRHVKEFGRLFWEIFYYVRSSVEINKLNPDLASRIEEWFSVFQEHGQRTDVLMCGVLLFLEFTEQLSAWGIGQLFEKSLEPPFLSPDDDNDLIMSDDEGEEIVEEDDLPEGVIEQ